MSEQPSPQETQRNRRYNDQPSYPQQQPTHQGQPRQPQPRRYAQGQQGRPSQNSQGGYQQHRPVQNAQRGYPQQGQAPNPNQPYPPQGQANPNQPYPPQGHMPYQQPQRPMPATNTGTSPLETIGKLVGGFFKMLAYPFVKVAQLVGRVLTIILEEMVRTVVSFIMGLVMLVVVGALIIGYAVALVSVEFNFVAAVPEMFRLFGQLVGMG